MQAIRRGVTIGLGGALLLLGGCGGGSDGPPAPCPRITILADGADLTRYREGAVPDLAAMTSDARIVGFNARCDYARRRSGVEVSVSVVFDVERGPAAAGREVRLPWFIAVTDANDGQVIERLEYVTPVTFDGTMGRMRVESRAVGLSFPADERLVENHNVRVSFQLTPDELALNRRRGPR